MNSGEEIPPEEGKINIIPSSNHLSSRLLLDKPLRLKSIFGKNIILKKKNKIRVRSVDSFSTTSMSSNFDKIKKVTFSTIEIIRIQNIKQFNKLNSYKPDENKNMMKDLDENDRCSIF